MKKDFLKKELNRAYLNLLDAVNKAETDLEIDGVIQRFEFTFELVWKFLKEYLYDQGIICNSPKSCLKEAYKANIIDNEELWISMLKDRNLSTHLYSFEISREIYQRIKELYIFEIKKILNLD
ncbi:MAG: HI0074 family nucleotidyltransferase substrate-binding subunit [bacterium]|jgi:nucleotidyltransferase substrate binding protein (TIGR01987 family)